MKHTLTLVFSLLLLHYAQSQDNLGYQTPPKALADLITAPTTPSVSADSKGNWLLILERAAAPSIAELAQPELRLAGLRINPATNGPSRVPFVIGLKLRQITNGKTDISVAGLPDNPRISNVQWSPDDSKIAFVHTTDSELQLYVLDVATATAARVGNITLNGALGSPYEWIFDNKSLICKTISLSRALAPQPTRVPTGPTVQENKGQKAQAATYQDLLKNPSDEGIFEYYATAQVAKVGLDGALQNIGAAGMIASATPSPNGQFVLIETIHRPFSYLVTVNRFPLKVDVFGSNGNLVKTLADNPLYENVPWGPDAVPTGQRNHNWRNDNPATVYWVEAQDGGDPKKKTDVRDKVYVLDAPFNQNPQEIYAAAYRFGGVNWGNAQTALFSERWYSSRKTITKIVNPSNSANPIVLFERSSEDRYADPGRPELKKNVMGQYVLDITANNDIYLTGLGASPEGDRPFVDKLNLGSKQIQRLWRSEGAFFERPVAILNAEKGLVLTSRESPEEQPNYFVRNINPQPVKKSKKAVSEPVLRQITFFAHPYPQLKAIQKQVLRYKRNDGVDLTATLLLPPGYKKEDGPLPTLLWAYPAEFKSAAAAGQVSGSPHQFNRVSYWSGAAFVTMGYAVLENASIPIVGEGDKEPNDTYVEQLVESAKAAINEGVRLGAVDANRVAAGGHSYGAFMTANLLTHSNLFKAGIARSGAYNRTLTPFGFQNEERTYWQAPEVYNKMSPFMNADKMKTPLLMTHGEADNNTGTFPIQSERYYNALKGMGATVRLVTFPYESHGYTAKESLLHLLTEMNGWLDKYVKNATAASASGTGKLSGEK